MRLVFFVNNYIKLIYSKCLIYNDLLKFKYPVNTTD